MLSTRAKVRSSLFQYTLRLRPIWSPIAKISTSPHRYHSKYPTQPHTNSPNTVIDAYSRSLRIVFISAIAMFFIANILVFAIELPHLKKKKEADVEGEDGAGVGNGT